MARVWVVIVAYVEQVMDWNGHFDRLVGLVEKRKVKWQIVVEAVVVYILAGFRHVAIDRVAHCLWN